MTLTTITIDHFANKLASKDGRKIESSSNAMGEFSYGHVCIACFSYGATYRGFIKKVKQ